MQLREDEVVFTKHAKERLKQRKISEDMILNAIEMPYQTYTQKDGGMKFICHINEREVHVVCQPLAEDRKWLVKTVWVRGEDDEGNIVKHDRNRLSLVEILLIFLILTILIAATVFLYFYTGGF